MAKHQEIRLRAGATGVVVERKLVFLHREGWEVLSESPSLPEACEALYRYVQPVVDTQYTAIRIARAAFNSGCRGGAVFREPYYDQVEAA